MAAVNNDIYAAEDDYNGVASVSPVAVRCCTLNSHYLYLDSCSAFNQVFTENHISDLKQVRNSLRARYNAGTSTVDEKGMHPGTTKAWLVRTGTANLASIP